MAEYFPFKMDHGNTDPSTWTLPEGAITRIGRGGIQDTAFSPNGKHLAIATYLGLWWYDVQKSELITLWEKGNTVSSVAFSNCGEWIATTSWGGPISIREVTTGECIIELPREERIPSTKIVFSENREYLAVGGYSRYSNPENKLYCCVEVWQLPQNRYELGTTDLPKRIGLYVGTNPLAFSSDSHLLAFASPDGEPEPYNKNGFPIIEEKGAVLSSNKVVIYEVETGKHLITLDGMNDIGSICFSPDRKHFAACDYNGFTQVWEVPEGHSTNHNEWKLHKTYHKPTHDGWHWISYTPESKLLFTFYDFSDDRFSVHNLETNEVLYKHPNETGFFTTHFSNDVHLAFESEYNFHYWKSGENRSVSMEHSSGVWPNSLMFSSDGKTLYATTGYWGILTYDITHPNNPPQIFKPHILKQGTRLGERYKSIEMSQQGRVYVTSGDDKSVRLWELGMDTPIASFPIQAPISDVIFSPITNLLACHDEENTIYIWDITTNEIYDTFTVESDDHSQYISFSPDGKYLICHYGQIYDVSERKLLDRYSEDDGINFHAFSSDSTKIWLDWTDDSIDLWDFLKDEEVMSIPKPEWWDSEIIESLTVSSCGKYMACSPYTWDCNGNLCMWDITKGTAEPIVTFTTEDSPKCLTFSHDNTILAGCCGDGTILLWDLTPYIEQHDD